MKPIQILRAHQRAIAADQKKKTGFVLFLLAMVAVIAAIGIFVDPSFSNTGMHLFCGSGSLALMMGIGNVEDISDVYTTGENIAYQVYLIDVSEQIDKTQAFPLPNASREVGQIPMSIGQYMKYFESHAIPTYTGTGDNGDITNTGTNSFVIVMAGIREQLLNFCEGHLGNKFIILFREVGETSWKILGSADKPMKLKKFDTKNDKEGRYITFTFERSSVVQYHTYAGALVVQAPAVHTADATTLAIAAGQNSYSVPDGTAATYAINAVSGITDSDKGRIITLKGTGTTKSATIAENSAFVLEGGATWTAKVGSSISFRILDSTTLVECGKRVQTV
jgi:hypothetical protein